MHATAQDLILAKRLEAFDRTVLCNPYIPIQPSRKQAQFLMLDDWPDVLFGGAAGGGKSAGLLMAALQYVHEPDYRGVLVRRETTMLTKGEGIYSLSHEWLGRTDAVWNEQKKVWRFPSGATVEFAHIQHEQDKRNFQGPAWQFVGFDELTQFTESMVQFVMGRRRRRQGSRVPIRMRGTSNPGDIGHEWVKRWFVPPEYLAAEADERRARIWRNGERLFVPSFLDENPGLDVDEYDRTLRGSLTGHVYQQMRYGDWSDYSGGIFDAGHFKLYDRQGAGQTAHYVFGDEIKPWDCPAPHWLSVDPASSDGENKGKTTHENSYCVVQHWGLVGNKIVLLDQWRKRATPLELDDKIFEWWREKRPAFVAIEDSPIGKSPIYHAQNKGVNVRPMSHLGQSKLVRATSYRIHVERGNVWVPRSAPWVSGFLGEHAQWQGTNIELTDQIDAAAYAIRIVDDYFRQSRGEFELITGKTYHERLLDAR